MYCVNILYRQVFAEFVVQHVVVISGFVVYAWDKGWLKVAVFALY